MSNPVSQTLYLHGLGSNGHSSTATGLHELGVAVVAPDYAPQHYHEAIEQLCTLVEALQPQRIIGTSMGGYYALKLHERYAMPTVAVNPCYAPRELLAPYLEQPAWDFVREAPITFTQAMLDAFEPITNSDAACAESEVLILVGRNDELIVAAGQREFCRQRHFRFVETDWGHRVGDVALLWHHAEALGMRWGE